MSKQKGIDDPKAAWNQTPKPKELGGTLYKAFTAYAGVIGPIMRSGQGTHGQAPYVYTLFLMFGYAVFGKCPHILPYIPAWLMLVSYRACIPDKYQHSAYRGYPWLVCLLPFVNTERKGLFIEPFVVLIVGLYLLPISAPLGVFIGGSGIASFMIFLVEEAMFSARKRQIHDAQVEAEWWARASKGDR